MSTPHTRRRATRITAAVLTGLCAISMSACAGSSTEKSSSSSSEPARTVMSCNEKLTFTSVPKRVIMLGDTDASTMNALGVLNHVVARAGRIKEGAYDAKTLAKLKAIPTIASQELNTGGFLSVHMASVLYILTPDLRRASRSTPVS